MHQLSFVINLFLLALKKFILLVSQLFGQYLLLVGEDVQVLLRGDQLLVHLVVSSLCSYQGLFFLLERLLEFTSLRHQKVDILLLAIQLSLQALDGCRRRGAVTLGLQLRSTQLNQFFLQSFVLMSNASDFFLGLVSLLSHGLNILHQTLNSLIQNLCLFCRKVVISVKFMHFVVVEFNVTSEVRATALKHADFFPELLVLQLNGTKS